MSELNNAVSFASVSASQDMWMFDIRPYVNYFERPDRSVLGAAARSIFPSDPALGFTEMTGRMAGCYRVVATTQPTAKVIIIQRQKRSVDGGLEDVSVPLQPYSNSGGTRREGTLVTIVDGDLGAARAIPGKAFDAAMGVFGEVVMRTKPQVDKVTGLMNCNRMCVVDTTSSKNPLPDRLQVEGIEGKSFLLKYKGKKWHCSSCNEMHEGACPYLKEFYAALDAKKAIKELNYAIIGDSTIRHTDHVGLAADVMSMPGATTGQLANAVKDMPKQTYKEVILVAGANDVRTSDITSEFLMAKRIDKSLKRLKEVASGQNIKIKVFSSSPPKRDQTNIENFSRMYFRDRLKKVFRGVNNVELLKGVPYTENWTQDRHPTQKCTEEMLIAMGETTPDLLINKDFITSDKMYRGLEKCWLSACSGCDARGYYREAFCPTCNNDVTNSDIYDDFEQVKKISEKIFEEDFPTRKRRHDSGSSGNSEVMISKYLHRDADDEQLVSE